LAAMSINEGKCVPGRFSMTRLYVHGRGSAFAFSGHDPGRLLRGCSPARCRQRYIRCLILRDQRWLRRRMQSIRFPWQRWLRSWLIFALWLGLMPVVVTATYYLVKKPSDFEPGLKLLQPDKPVWALRVGSASCERPNLSINSASFGVNADNPSFDRARSEVWNRDLYGTYQATYVGWFRGAVLPEVFTVSRNLTRRGDVSYGTWRNGRKPIANYLFLILIVGTFATFIVEVIGVFQKKS
jgi:hypothetical protein